MNIQHFLENGNQKFPLSTAALDFIQEQIKLVYGLTDLAGTNIIIKNSTATANGLIIFGGELLPLSGTPSRYIYVDQQVESLSIEGFEGNVRTSRIAVYSSAMSRTATQQALASQFTVLKNISTLMAEFEEAKQHHVPMGAIMIWSGTIADIPTGWALCNGQNGTPNLQARFIVGAGNSIVMDGSVGYQYPVGATGGKNKVTLSTDEMPTHNHGGSTSASGVHSHSVSVTGAMPQNYGGGSSWNSANLDAKSSETPSTSVSAASAHSHTISNAGGNVAHENRPLYYALAYIMKVI